MKMMMIQVITLLMLKRLHVDPVTMTLGGLKFQKKRVGLYCLKKASPAFLYIFAASSPKYVYGQPLILTTAASSKTSSFPSSTMQWTEIPWFTFHYVHVRRY